MSLVVGVAENGMSSEQLVLFGCFSTTVESSAKMSH
jgi:hypothetical protein